MMLKKTITQPFEKNTSNQTGFVDFPDPTCQTIVQHVYGELILLNL